MIIFEGTWQSLKKAFPVNNAVVGTDWDAQKGEAIFHTKNGDIPVKKGDVIVRDLKGNVSVISA